MGEKLVILSQCGKNEVCESNTSVFFESNEFQREISYCKSITPPVIKATALPGESCLSSAQCKPVTFTYPGITSIQTFQICDEATHVCVGRLKGETCTDHSSCVAGNYCIGGACKPLVKEDFYCHENAMCPMSQFCDGKKCVNMFSQDDFTNVSDAKREFQDLICKSGFAFNGICARQFYINPYISSKGVLPCNDDSQCHYAIQIDENKYVESSQTCACTYGANSAAVCPRALHDPSNAKLLQEAQNAAKVLLNASLKLHTLNRMGAKMPAKDSMECALFNLGASVETARFINSVECAFSVLGGNPCESNSSVHANLK